MGSGLEGDDVRGQRDASVRMQEPPNDGSRTYPRAQVVSVILTVDQPGIGTSRTISGCAGSSNAVEMTVRTLVVPPAASVSLVYCE